MAVISQFVWALTILGASITSVVLASLWKRDFDVRCSTSNFYQWIMINGCVGIGAGVVIAILSCVPKKVHEKTKLLSLLAFLFILFHLAWGGYGVWLITETNKRVCMNRLYDFMLGMVIVTLVNFAVGAVIASCLLCCAACLLL